MDKTTNKWIRKSILAINKLNQNEKKLTSDVKMQKHIGDLILILQLNTPTPYTRENATFFLKLR